MHARYLSILIFVITLHVCVLSIFLFQKRQVIAPQVLTASLVGSLIHSSSFPTSDQENTSDSTSSTVAQSAPPARALQPTNTTTIIEPLRSSQETPVVNESPKPLTSLPSSSTALSTRPLPARPEISPSKPRSRPLPSPLSTGQTVSSSLQNPASTSNARESESNHLPNALTSETVQEQGKAPNEEVTAPTSHASSLNNAKPAYPALSRRLNEEGEVILRVLVSSQGQAKSVEVKKSSGFARLDQAALNAVRRWRFIPAKRGSTPIEMWYELPIKFSLNN